jgi:signal peptidase II
MKPKHKAFLIAFVLSIGADQASKIWARAVLKPRYPEPLTVISGFWDMLYSENTGVAFGMFRNVPGAKYFFYVVGAIALAVVWSYLKKAAPEARRLAVELGLLAGGALGNLIDRAFFGYVTDFVLWKAGSFRWPTFNIADAALVIGVLGLVVDLREKDADEEPVDKKKAKKGA